MSLLEDVANRIRTIRKLKGKNLDHLAHALGVSRGYISKLETGRKPINLENIEKIAQALEVPTEDILVGGTSLWKSNPTFRELMAKFTEEELLEILEHTQYFIKRIRDN